MIGFIESNKDDDDGDEWLIFVVPVQVSAWNNSAATGWIFLDTGDCLENSSLAKIGQKYRALYLEA